MTVIKTPFVLFFVLMLSAFQAQAAEYPNFKPLIKQNADAVVNISASQEISQTQQQQIPEIFKRFFGDQIPFEMPQQRQEDSLGSGFIISRDGYILSNHHVIENADKVIVRLTDRRELEAEVIGSDPETDVAILKVNAKDLPYVKIGNSDKLEAGDWVVAIGSPFGFDYSVTAGIVSATGRSLPGDNYVPFIQTDVAINPGNSGGPLFNMDGEVIGINSQIYSRTGGFMGLSFAIPIDVAMNVADQLKSKGRVDRGWLGVMIQDVNRELAESFGLSKPHGALIAEVVKDSPAEKAGLLAGDVITAFNNKEIVFSSDLPHLVGQAKPNSRHRLTVIRNGKAKLIGVRLGALDSDEAQVLTNNPPQQVEKLGLIVTELSEKEKTQYNIDHGVRIADVVSQEAKQAGLSAGNIVLQVDNVLIHSVDQYERVIDRLKEDRYVPVLVLRNGAPTYIALPVK